MTAERLTQPLVPFGRRATEISTHAARVRLTRKVAGAPCSVFLGRTRNGRPLCGLLYTGSRRSRATATRLAPRGKVAVLRGAGALGFVRGRFG